MKPCVRCPWLGVDAVCRECEYQSDDMRLDEKLRRENKMCYMSLVGCSWSKVHQDLRPCRGCDKMHLQYTTEVLDESNLIYIKDFKL